MGAVGSTANENVAAAGAYGASSSSHAATGELRQGVPSTSHGQVRDQQYFGAQGVAGGGGGAGALLESSRESGTLPVELSNVDANFSFREPPSEGDDADCDMRLWTTLPDHHSKGLLVSSKRQDGTVSREDPHPTVQLSEEDLRDPPQPRLAANYFDEDIGEGPRQNHDGGQGGRRRFVFHSGAEYDGEWQNGHRHGVGRQTWPDSAEYIGEWHHGRANGNGRMRHSDGDVYSGQWINGRAHGHGVYRYQGNQAWYEGEFKSDLRDGNGTEQWQDGSYYAGAFRHGTKHGLGSHTWPDGTVYAGWWNNNELVGVGLYDVMNGPKYQGHWKESVIHGFGIYEWPGGRRYEGHYDMDRKHGFGILFEEDGTQNRGFWEHGKLLLQRSKRVVPKPVTSPRMPGSKKHSKDRAAR